MEKPQYALVTGLLARKSLEGAISCLSGVSLRILELKCPVAALMSTQFIADNLSPIYDKTETILIPGLCRGPLQPIIDAAGCLVKRGPNDLWDLPRFFQEGSSAPMPPLTSDDMQIVAEIVDASRLDIREILKQAAYFRESGADIIDLGGSVEQPFPCLTEVIRELKGQGFRCSVDSHLREDILAASAAGAELILSLTSQNLQLAKGLDCSVVVIPDDGESLDSLYRNMDRLESWNVSYLVDPILPPPCMGLAAGIGRLIQVRRDFPDSRLFTGLGNVTEMIDADSVGVNAILTIIAAELSVQYVLTTEVSHRAIGAVKEIALARGLSHRALRQGRVPKHIEESLLVLKESAASSYCEEDFRHMRGLIQDQSYRIFIADQIYCFNGEHFVQGSNAIEIFSQLDIESPGHAFYLGRELERAQTALMLKKKYIQDNPLRWGYMNDS